MVIVSRSSGGGEGTPPYSRVVIFFCVCEKVENRGQADLLTGPTYKVSWPKTRKTFINKASFISIYLQKHH